MEENLISEIDSTYQVYLKGNETIHIPFKLQCFATDIETPEIVSSLCLLGDIFLYASVFFVLSSRHKISKDGQKVSGNLG